MSYQQGSIFWLDEVLDEHGRNPKTRPAILVTPNSELATVDRLWFVCGTTKFDRPLPSESVKLPFLKGRPHPRTGLKDESVAVTRWLHSVSRSQVLPEPIGHCPAPFLQQILAQIKSL